MSFADPQTLGATSLPRTGQDRSSGIFQTADGTVALSVSHSYGKRTRRTARIDVSKVSSDPLIPSQNTKSSMSVYIVVDVPVNGFTVTEQKTETDKLVAWLSASTGANVTSLLGGQS